MNKQKTQLIGIAILAVGAILLLSTGSFEGMILGDQKTMTISGDEGERMQLTVEKENEGLAFEPGTTHKWKLSMENTGDIDWNDAWFTVRVGVEGAEIGTIDTDQAYDELQDLGFDIPQMLYGEYAAFKCNGIVDDISCRDRIVGVWNARYLSDAAVDNYRDRVATFQLGQMDTGESKEIKIKVDVPQNLEAEEERILLANGVAATNARTTVIGYVHDTVNAGGITGNVSMTYIGIVLVLAGGYLSLVGRFPKI